MAYRGFSNGRVVLCFQQTWCWVPFSSQTLLASRCSRAWPVQYSCGPTPRSRTLQLPLHLWAQRSAPGPRADGAGLPPAVANWFPGHIAKAMRELRDRLSLIDVVVEVVDARIPYTTYPLFIHELIGNKSRVLALNRIDMVPSVAGRTWLRALRRGALDTGCSVTAPEGTCVWPCVATDGKIGTGIPQLRRACIAAGTTVNERRAQRGLLPRPVRVVVIGFPNVGKSALINRLCGRRAAVSAARPGVTRQLQWVRLTQDLELLDTPGIIPPKLEDQEASSRLAMCDDIGETAYDVERIASMLVDSLLALEGSRWIEHSTVAIEEQHSARAILEKRYGCSGFSNGEEFLHLAAEKCTQKNVEKMSRRLLTDFRQLSLGRICLEPLVDRIESNTDSTALRH
ncbi:hypothetical protein CCYA_CCYA01G0423 [Cyanidiococcus yangmingshanensis]|nr:hypothetical protein CCYA_CCYA01G0423 [Cyanidiococcus yangmingshanensis]